jgi:hypothetical protein
MIQANELRIGDLFIDKLTKEYLKVSSINDDGKIVYNVINRDAFPLPNGWGAIPIPLTEDILLKCGFVDKGVTFNTKINFTRCCLFKVNSSNNYNNNENEFSVTLYQHHNSIEIARIKYLHQLQNLFFALTGEELNIEP